MNRDAYKKDLANKKRKLTEKLEQREVLDREIAELRADIGALAQLTGEAVPFLLNDFGLTDACREVLRTADEPLSPADVGYLIHKMGYDTERYTNFAASVHTTLNRMVLHGEAEPSTKDGRKHFKLKLGKYSAQRRAHAKRQNKQGEQ